MRSAGPDEAGKLETCCHEGRTGKGQPRPWPRRHEDCSGQLTDVFPTCYGNSGRRPPPFTVASASHPLGSPFLGRRRDQGETIIMQKKPAAGVKKGDKPEQAEAKKPQQAEAKKPEQAEGITTARTPDKADVTTKPAKAKKKPPIASQGVWGLDLGQCALKALRLQEIDGQLTATAFDYVEYPKILSQPDADPDQLIREALQQFLSRNDIRGDQ